MRDGAIGAFEPDKIERDCDIRAAAVLERQAAKAWAFASLRHAPIQGGEPARRPAQSSSSSSLSARRRPVCESTAILLASPFIEPVTSIYLPLRETATFDHPSVCNFSNTCSAVTGRSPAMKAGAEACCAFAIIRPTLPTSNATPITDAMSRFMSLLLRGMWSIDGQSKPDPI